MKRIVLLEDSSSSPHSSVQQMEASGSPNWWHINSMPPSQSPVEASSSLIPPPSAPTSSWNDNLEVLDSWSQPLMGGFFEEEDKSSHINDMQEANKKLENFDQQYGKLENSSADSFSNKKNVEFQDMAIERPSIWSHQMPTFSPRSSCVTSSTSNFFEFSIKSDARHPPLDYHSSECNSTAGGSSAKKARVQPSSTQSTFKVRKEKLGDRITALHQIVSPFGKTDTASVLLEVIGYIRFLQNQIEALTLPYLVSGSGNTKQKHQWNPTVRI